MSTLATMGDARSSSRTAANPSSGMSMKRMCRTGTDAVSVAPASDKRAASAASSAPSAKVTMKETVGPAGAGSLGAGGGSSEGLGSAGGAVGTSEGSGFEGADAGVASGVGSVVGSAVGSGGGAEGSADALLSGGGVGSVASAANGDMSVDMKTTSVKMI